MKIALHCNATQANAEAELACRIVQALENLGHRGAACSQTRDIMAFEPDLVLALHMDFAKLTRFPTFGCMWNPPVFFADNASLMKNVATYDGYFCGSSRIEAFVTHFCGGLNKEAPLGVLYPSACEAPFIPLDFSKARLSYVGTNWDGKRHDALIQILASKAYFDIYGPSQAWAHLIQGYRGQLPFDGETLIATLKETGVSLCLHRPEHLAWKVPNMRVFEAAAACNVLICDDHAFVREIYGDSVYYLDRQLPPDGLADQITGFLEQIKAAPKTSLEMAKACNEVFNSQFSLEKLLTPLLNASEIFQPLTLGINSKSQNGGDSSSLPSLSQLEQDKGAGAETADTIDCIVRTGFRSTTYLGRALASIAQQTKPVSRVIIVNHGNNSDVVEAVLRFKDRFMIDIIDIPEAVNRSHSLWKGLRGVRAKFFCILDDDDVFFPHHVDTLLTALHANGDAVLAYGGSLRVLEPADLSEDGGALEARSLAYLEPFDAKRLLTGPNYIPSNAFLARSNALNEHTLKDPNLTALEDYWLLIQLLNSGRFQSVLDVTSEIHWRKSEDDNIMFERDVFEQAAEHIRTRLLMHPLPLAYGVDVRPIIREDSHEVWLNEEKTIPRSISWIDIAPKTARRFGNIDTIQFADGVITIEGWAPTEDQNDVFQLCALGIAPHTSVDVTTIMRPDVCRHLKDWSMLRSGFKLVMSAATPLSGSQLRLFAVSSTQAFELNAPKRRFF
jgi:hypothetical protein